MILMILFAFGAGLLFHRHLIVESFFLDLLFHSFSFPCLSFFSYLSVFYSDIFHYYFFPDLLHHNHDDDGNGGQRIQGMGKDGGRKGGIEIQQREGKVEAKLQGWGLREFLNRKGMKGSFQHLMDNRVCMIEIENLIGFDREWMKIIKGKDSKG